MGKVALIIISGFAGEFTDFLERALIDEQIDPFANSIKASVVVKLDAVFAAHFFSPLAAFSDLIGFRLPGHI